MMRLAGKLARLVKNQGVFLTPPFLARRPSTERVQPLTDPGIETLSEVLDPIALAKQLAGVSRAPWNGQAHRELQVRVLRHHAGQRCTLEIALRTEQGWHFMIGKVYQADCAELFQAMKGIQQAGFGPWDEFSIPSRLLTWPRCVVSCRRKWRGRRRVTFSRLEMNRAVWQRPNDALGGWPGFTPLDLRRARFRTPTNISSLSRCSDARAR